MDKKISYNNESNVYYVKNESRRARFYKDYSQLIFIVTIPLLASILPISLQNKEACCAFVLIVMAGYWITECLPYAIVSLLPIPLFPLFDIMPSKEVSKIYFSDILMLFFGGLIVAICVESSGLHKKIAFRVIMLFGSNPIWLLLGTMGITGFLSLWISNVASASMMLPIVMAMVVQLAEIDKTFSEEKPNKNHKIPINSQFALTQEMDSLEDMAKGDEERNEIVLKGELPNTKAAKNLMKCFLLSLTYSASIGGSGSLVGTAPNLILKGYFDEYYPDAGLNFFSFMLYSTPAAFLLITLTWVTLFLYWLPRRTIMNMFKKKETNGNDKLGEFIQKEYNKLGPLTWEQGSVGGLFILLVLLWISRDLFFAPGWGDLFTKGYPSDVTPVIFIVILLTAWPRENIFKGHVYRNLITWKEINEKFAWNVILLSGGGLALAAGFDKSGLSDSVGEFLSKIMPPQKELSLLVLLLFSFTMTEFTSNTSMASIMIPITASLAEKNGFSPSYLLLPLTVSTSYSFCLPIATPTNAIVFGTDHLTIIDMLVSGSFLKITGIIVLFLSTLWRPIIIPDQNLINTVINGTMHI